MPSRGGGRRLLPQQRGFPACALGRLNARRNSRVASRKCVLRQGHDTAEETTPAAEKRSGATTTNYGTHASEKCGRSRRLPTVAVGGERQQHRRRGRSEARRELAVGQQQHRLCPLLHRRCPRRESRTVDDGLLSRGSSVDATRRCHRMLLLQLLLRVVLLQLQNRCGQPSSMLHAIRRLHGQGCCCSRCGTCRWHWCRLHCARRHDPRAGGTRHARILARGAAVVEGRCVPSRAAHIARVAVRVGGLGRHGQGSVELQGSPPGGATWRSGGRSG